jgi:CubicO group peptidase (beta-lactamase class C family)
MKKTCTFFCLSLLLLSWDNHSTPIRPENDKSISDFELIKKYVAVYPDGTQLSFAFLKDGEVTFLGLKKINDSLLVTDNKDSVFEIGSITKVFTTFILSDLILHHIINLNGPISEALPFKLKESGKNDTAITFMTLANHTSGLPRDPENNLFNKYPDNPYGGYNIEELKDYLQNIMSLNSTPGEVYEYSNLGMGLLGYLLELKTGKTYESLLQDRIFLKYKMFSSSTYRTSIKNNIIKGQDSIGKVIPNWDFGSMAAAGGVYSNAADLSKFVSANFSSDSVFSFQRKHTYRSKNTNVALGWHIIRFGDAPLPIWHIHGGGTGGYRSEIFMDANNKIAIIILSNVSVFNRNTGNLGKLGFELLKKTYISEKIYQPYSMDAPFIEFALKKGWGTRLNDSINKIHNSQNPIIGVWQKETSNKTITYTFMPDKKWQCDFFNDSEIDVWGSYNLEHSRIALDDIGGAACGSEGLYDFQIKGDTLKFKLVADQCEGRSKGLEGIWIRKK